MGYLDLLFYLVYSGWKSTLHVLHNLRDRGHLELCIFMTRGTPEENVILRIFYDQRYPRGKWHFTAQFIHPKLIMTYQTQINFGWRWHSELSNFSLTLDTHFLFDTRHSDTLHGSYLIKVQPLRTFHNSLGKKNRLTFRIGAPLLKYIEIL